MRVTATLLYDKDACLSQRKVFRRLFPIPEMPDGVEVTEALCVSVAEEFDWDWAGQELLPWEQSDAYADGVSELYSQYAAATAGASEAHAQELHALELRFRKREVQVDEYADLREEALSRFRDATQGPANAYRRGKAALFGRLAEQVV